LYLKIKKQQILASANTGFAKLRKYLLNSPLYFARNFIFDINNELRSSQLRKASNVGRNARKNRKIENYPFIQKIFCKLAK
jgi:hypothetical protein